MKASLDEVLEIRPELREGAARLPADEDGGSANVANRSFYGDTELNASFWHAPTVRALRAELLREHLARDTSGQGDRAALRLFREVARANAERRSRGQPLDGLAVALDPARYAA